MAVKWPTIPPTIQARFFDVDHNSERDTFESIAEIKHLEETSQTSDTQTLQIEKVLLRICVDLFAFSF